MIPIWKGPNSNLSRMMTRNRTKTEASTKMTKSDNIADVGFFLSFSPEEKALVTRILAEDGYGEGAGELKRWLLDTMRDYDSDGPDRAEAVRRYIVDHPEEILNLADAGRTAIKKAASVMREMWGSTVREAARK